MVEKILGKCFHETKLCNLPNYLKRIVLPEVTAWILPKLLKKMHQDCAYALLRSLLNNTARNCYCNLMKCLLSYFNLLIKFHNGPCHYLLIEKLKFCFHFLGGGINRNNKGNRFVDARFKWTYSFRGLSKFKIADFQR